MWGAHDKVNRPNGGLALARRMPSCDLVFAANAGHWVQWERSTLFNQLVRMFLADAHTNTWTVRG